MTHTEEVSELKRQIAEWKRQYTDAHNEAVGWRSEVADLREENAKLIVRANKLDTFDRAADVIRRRDETIEAERAVRQQLAADLKLTRPYWMVRLLTERDVQAIDGHLAASQALDAPVPKSAAPAPAALRVASLDGTVEMVPVIRRPLPEIGPVAERPTCETCGGRGWITTFGLSARGDTYPCPDCPVVVEVPKP